MKQKRIGDLLIELGIINEEQLKFALDKQKETKKKIGQTLIDLGIISQEAFYEVLQMQYNIPFFDLNTAKLEPKIPKLISEDMARTHSLIPVKFEGDTLVVAMADPLDVFAQDDIKLITGFKIKAVISSPEAISNAINRYYDSLGNTDKVVSEYAEGFEELTEEQIENDEVANSPIVKLVNSILIQSIKEKASDIHIEPFESNVKVRLRVDGILKEVLTLPRITMNALVARIKIIAKLDISERRIPQDGRVEMNVEEHHIDMRVSILPTVFGEKIVIRLLDRSGIMLTKAQLGFSKHNEELFNKVLSVPEGIILITGPTGSGKSTTLYTVLREFNKPTLNVITVEDPVEYRLEGINQVQTNAKAGLTFASALRSILRQDPDIVMVGEIRDSETAEIAARAAITGHLVLSTLHTNDAASTLTRLVDMGIEPFMVGTAVKGILAQRLVRRICKFCLKEQEATGREKMILGADIESELIIAKGEGCIQCNNTGYKGRVGIHEILLVNSEIQSMITKGADANQLKECALKNGMLTLQMSAAELVKEKITTVEELLRVTFSID